MELLDRLNELLEDYDKAKPIMEQEYTTDSFTEEHKRILKEGGLLDDDKDEVQR